MSDVHDDVDGNDEFDDDEVDDEVDDANRVVGALPKNVLTYLAKSIVEDPEAVVVETEERAVGSKGGLPTASLHVRMPPPGYRRVIRLPKPGEEPAEERHLLAELRGGERARAHEGVAELHGAPEGVRVMRPEPERGVWPLDGLRLHGGILEHEELALECHARRGLLVFQTSHGRVEPDRVSQPLGQRVHGRLLLLLSAALRLPPRGGAGALQPQQRGLGRGALLRQQ